MVTSDMSMLSREFVMNDEYAGGSDSVDLGDIRMLDHKHLRLYDHCRQTLYVLRWMVVLAALERWRINDFGSIVLKNNKMQEMVRYTFQQALG